jgi:thioredoxin-related protein
MFTMHTKKLILGFVFLIVTGYVQKAFAQDTPKINWLTIEQAFEAQKKNPKKVFIDVYTDWCGWCKVMDQKTFSNGTVAKYANETYYAVKLNAEQEGTVTLGDKKYTYPEIASQLLQGQMSYPTVVYLDEKFNMIQPVAGYQDATVFHQVITFLGGNHNKKEDFEKFKTGTYLKKYSIK